MDKAARAIRNAAGFVEAYKNQASNIARTEIQRVANSVAHDTYAANLDVIKGVTRLATLDTRTCMVCAPLHNVTWLYGPDGNLLPNPEHGPHITPPLHPRCRCFDAPLTKSFAELGLPVGLSRRDRERLDGSLPQNMTYPEWFGRQSKARQLEILGPARLKLYEQGKVDIGGFADANRVLSLAELDTLQIKNKSEAFRAVWGDGGVTPKGLVKTFRGVDQKPGSKVVMDAFDSVPSEIKRAALKNKAQVKVYNTIGEYDPDLMGVTPRGWPPNLTWDDVRGLQQSGNAVVAVDGTLGGSSLANVALHEWSHAIDYRLSPKPGVYATSESWWLDAWTDATRADATGTSAVSRWAEDSSSYFEQDPPAGPQELWAEVMAHSWESPEKRASVEKHFPGMLDSIAERIADEWF
tara:strand:- start:412 stop:1638 length:1227 start_codon:yes stop_codon:yes gene_type:complete